MPRHLAQVEKGPSCLSHIALWKRRLEDSVPEISAFWGKKPPLKEDNIPGHVSDWRTIRRRILKAVPHRGRIGRDQGD
jgi:hypothetical protein